MGLRGSSGYLNTASEANSDSESDEDFDLERYPEAKQMKNQCMRLSDALNNRFFPYDPLFCKSASRSIPKISATGDSKQFPEPSRPTKIPKAVQILQGIPDEDTQAAFKRGQDQHKNFTSLRKLQALYIKKKKTLLEKNHLMHLKDIKKNEKQKQRLLKEEQKKAESADPEVAAENKTAEKA